ncbi:MAG: hypothetical protein HQL02_04525 [Nitrospirae bacterium]|nr:hypothetical protein [Nitrospirota bacterium]
MFDIDNSRRFDSDLPLIEHNYQTLLFDNEPILYTGTNKHGNRILGSSVDECYKKKVERYFHTIIDPKTYNDFLRRKITYLSIMQKAKDIFVIDQSFDGDTIQTYIINIDDIPKDYLPSEKSFCPNQEIHPSLSFALKLKGELADLHLAVPKQLGIIQNSFSGLLNSSFESLKEFMQKPDIRIAPYAIGSFNIKFDIILKEQPFDLFENDDMWLNFINEYMIYCTNYLPNEVDAIFTHDKETHHFNKILESYQNLFNRSYDKMPDKRRKILLNVIRISASELGELAKNIGTNFTSIEVNNVENDIETPIGILDSSFIDSIQNTIEIIEDKTSRIYTDKEPQEYEIQIYHINTKTRRGNANIRRKDIMSKPEIKILGDDPLEETKYTESLHLSKWIKVKGIARTVDDKVKSIDVVFET